MQYFIISVLVLPNRHKLIMSAIGNKFNIFEIAISYLVIMTDTSKSDFLIIVSLILTLNNIINRTVQR